MREKEDLLEKPELANFVEDNSPYMIKNSKNVRVATYNILNSFAYQPQNGDAPEAYQLSWAFRKSLVLDLIEKLDLDILALQEVTIEQYHFFNEHLTKFAMIGYASETGRALHEISADEYVGELVPILYHKETMICLDSRVFWLSETPTQASKGWDASRPRILVCAAFENRTNGQRIVVGNTHYDHLGNEALVHSGVLEARLLEQYRLEQKASDIIYMGDRNCFTDRGHHGNEWYQTIKKISGAQDARTCGNTVGLGTTFLGFEPDAFKAKYQSASDRFQPTTLDLILHKGERYQLASYKCTSGEYQIKDHIANLLPFFKKVQNPIKRQFASDHCMVIADLKPRTEDEKVIGDKATAPMFD